MPCPEGFYFERAPSLYITRTHSVDFQRCAEKNDGGTGRLWPSAWRGGGQGKISGKCYFCAREVFTARISTLSFFFELGFWNCKKTASHLFVIISNIKISNNLRAITLLIYNQIYWICKSHERIITNMPNRMQNVWMNKPVRKCRQNMFQNERTMSCALMEKNWPGFT